MPEGPEVKRIGLGLAEAASGKTIANINIVSGRYLKKDPGGYQMFISHLPLKVVGVGVHGKFIFWICENEKFIWSTLGMSGSWSSKSTKHTRIKIEFTDSSSVYYNDVRNFGTIKFVNGKHKMIDKLESLGPDMLSQEVDDNLFIKSLRVKNNWQITKALMDQSIVSGVGNYVKADSLWLAKISPLRKVSELSDKELSVLNRSIKSVLKESFESGGATISTYKDFDGESGDYGRKFLVYSQKKDPDGNDIIKEETDDGRSTYWVPEVQK